MTRQRISNDDEDGLSLPLVQSTDGKLAEHADPDDPRFMRSVMGITALAKLVGISTEPEVSRTFVAYRWVWIIIVCSQFPFQMASMVVYYVAGSPVTLKNALAWSSGILFALYITIGYSVAIRVFRRRAVMAALRFACGPDCSSMPPGDIICRHPVGFVLSISCTVCSLVAAAVAWGIAVPASRSLYVSVGIYSFISGWCCGVTALLTCLTLFHVLCRAITMRLDMVKESVQREVVNSGSSVPPSSPIPSASLSSVRHEVSRYYSIAQDARNVGAAVSPWVKAVLTFAVVSAAIETMALLIIRGDLDLSGSSLGTPYLIMQFLYGIIAVLLLLYPLFTLRALGQHALEVSRELSWNVLHVASRSTGSAADFSALLQFVDRTLYVYDFAGFPVNRVAIATAGTVSVGATLFKLMFLLD